METAARCSGSPAVMPNKGGNNLHPHLAFQRVCLSLFMYGEINKQNQDSGNGGKRLGHLANETVRCATCCSFNTSGSAYLAREKSNAHSPVVIIAIAAACTRSRDTGAPAQVPRAAVLAITATQSVPLAYGVGQNSKLERATDLNTWQRRRKSMS